MKRFISAVCIILLLALPVLPVSAQNQLSLDQTKRGEIVDVPDSFYYVKDYNGDQSIKRMSYKSITIPNGYMLVSHGYYAKWIEYDTYFDNIKRESVSFNIYTYSFERI